MQNIFNDDAVTTTLRKNIVTATSVHTFHLADMLQDSKISVLCISKKCYMCVNTMCASAAIVNMNTLPLCGAVDPNVVACILCHLDDFAEGRTPPGPGVVRNDVGRVGDEWSGVCVELAHLVRRTSPLPV